MSVEPITPDDVTTQKQLIIPDEVIESFNEMIAQNFSGGGSTFKQNEVVKLICKKMKLRHNDIIYDKHWLDVESLYRERGWVVLYDKPGFNESYDATFSFARKK